MLHYIYNNHVVRYKKILSLEHVIFGTFYSRTWYVQVRSVDNYFEVSSKKKKIDHQKDRFSFMQYYAHIRLLFQNAVTSQLRQTHMWRRQSRRLTMCLIYQNFEEVCTVIFLLYVKHCMPFPVLIDRWHINLPLSVRQAVASMFVKKLNSKT